MLNILLTLFSNSFFVSYIRSKSFELPLSSHEEKYYLAKKIAGDQKARDTLIERNLRLVAHIAKKYDSQKDLQEDLISIGTIGLIKAIDSFKPDKNIKLATYASRCIENEILMHLRSNKKTNNDISLNEVIGVDKDGSEIVLEDLLENNDLPLIDQVDQNDKINILIDNFPILTSKEQTILINRYGLNHHKKLTQKEIAQAMKISRSYVSRIEKRALIKLYKAYIKQNNS